MQSAQLWELFQKTGNIGVYILYKQTQEQNGLPTTKEGENTDANSGFGHSDKRNRFGREG